MNKFRLFAITMVLLTFSPVSFSADTSACMNCHDDGEFAGMSAADIITDARDPGIPPHQQFSDVSDQDLQAIAAALAGG